MAKRELSSTLRNLKFMQRAALREENSKEEENSPTNSNITRKCVVIMEGDPRPGALKGRMSFQSFNLSVDKLNEREARLSQPGAEPESTISNNKNANVSFSNLANGNAKRKRVEVICDAQYPDKLPKNEQGNRASSSKNSLVSFRKPMGDKLHWNVLKTIKVSNKTG